MPTNSRRPPTAQAFGAIPAEFLEAKAALRDELLRPRARIAAGAFAARAAGRHTPAPEVNVVGVGIGEKITAGRRTGELCVNVFVAKKFPKGRIPRGDVLPDSVNGLPTDVRAVGYPRKFVIDQRKRHRPVVGGLSVGPDSAATPGFIMAGTLGVFVRDTRKAGALHVLSNNHVLADENRIAIGAGIVQPGTLDGGTNASRVARLSKTVDLRFDNKQNWMDASLATMNKGIPVDPTIMGIGVPTGAGDPTLNLLVRKSGRTTGLTEGVVRVVRFDVFSVEYDQGMVRVDDVIVIESTTSKLFSKSGDSGSAIIDPQGRVVALLFGGSDVVTYAIPIKRILKRFKVRIAT
jgi:Trypsin-like peptidase domain